MTILLVKSVACFAVIATTVWWVAIVIQNSYREFLTILEEELASSFLNERNEIRELKGNLLDRT